jgi:hypothetical protein
MQLPPLWQRSQRANLIRHVPSGTYYARNSPSGQAPSEERQVTAQVGTPRRAVRGRLGEATLPKADLRPAAGFPAKACPFSTDNSGKMTGHK